MIVKTQAELDAALANPRVTVIEIRSERGVWLRVRGQRPDVRVVARESSSVEAWGSSSVEAWGSSSVVARESSSVVARESSSVVARGSSSVVATPHVAIHLHSARATVQGGVIIDVTQVDKTAENWLEHHGITVNEDGKAVLYKAVDDRWTTGRGFDYAPGNTVSAPDWRDTDECGYGLHFGPTPRQAMDYHSGATKFVAVEVDAASIRPISGGGTPKCKVQSCTVLYEVDVKGKRIEATS